MPESGTDDTELIIQSNNKFPFPRDLLVTQENVVRSPQVSELMAPCSDIAEPCSHYHRDSDKERPRRRVHRHMSPPVHASIFGVKTDVRNTSCQ